MLGLQLGCAAAPGAIVNAAVNTAIAGTASGISRASGGCYAACPVGTRCDTTTGFCESIPCRDLCSTDEMCEGNAISERCVPKANAQLNRSPAAAPPRIDPR
jgi:hypothetical protein